MKHNAGNRIASKVLFQFRSEKTWGYLTAGDVYRSGYFTVKFVFHAHNAGVYNTLNVTDRFFNHVGIDFLAAAVDLVFLPIYHIEKTVVIYKTEVPSRKPIHFLDLSICIDITQTYRRSPDLNFANFPVIGFTSIVSHDA